MTLTRSCTSCGQPNRREQRLSSLRRGGAADLSRVRRPSTSRCLEVAVKSVASTKTTVTSRRSVPVCSSRILGSRRVQVKSGRVHSGDIIQSR
jgi:hypothetical protein